MTPLSSYFAVVCSEGASFVSHPYALTAASRLVRSPWLDSRPAVALPLLYSRMSGAAFEFSTWLAVERICSKDFGLELDLGPGLLLELLDGLGPGDAHGTRRVLVVPQGERLAVAIRIRVNPSLLAEPALPPLEQPARAIAPMARMATAANCLLRISYLLVEKRHRTRRGAATPMPFCCHRQHTAMFTGKASTSFTGNVFPNFDRSEPVSRKNCHFGLWPLGCRPLRDRNSLKTGLRSRRCAMPALPRIAAGPRDPCIEKAAQCTATSPKQNL